MLTYWSMFLVLASMALFVKGKQQANLLPWILVGFFFILLIGLRHEVGGDFGTYVKHYERTIGISLTQALRLHGDLGHQFLNWLTAKGDLGVYGIDTIYGAVFMMGLIKLSREQTYPWLAMTVAVPYLIIVVAMGYSRQSMAIGLFMWGITYLRKGKFKTYIAFILFAALFHKTAVLLLPLGIFLYGKGMFLRILMILPIAYGVWDLVLSAQQDHLWEEYVEKQMKSEGAKIRVFMNFIPSLLLLMYRKEWRKSYDDYQFWFWIALGSIIGMGLVNFASTAVDRVALYFIPIQLVVFARLPYLARKQISPSATIVMIILGYTAVLFVWLNFATHAHAWLPYQNFIFLDLV